MEYKKRNAEKSEEEEEEDAAKREGERTAMSNREKQENSRFFGRLQTRGFYSGVHSCAYLDVIHVRTYTVSSRVRRNDWSRKFLLSAQALKFMSRVLSLLWSTFLLLSTFPFLFLSFVSHFVSIFLFFLVIVSIFRNGVSRSSTMRVIMSFMNRVTSNQIKCRIESNRIESNHILLNARLGLSSSHVGSMSQIPLKMKMAQSFSVVFLQVFNAPTN